MITADDFLYDLSDRHASGANALYVDGHAKWDRKDYLITADKRFWDLD